MESAGREPQRGVPVPAALVEKERFRRGEIRSITTLSLYDPSFLIPTNFTGL